MESFYLFSRVQIQLVSPKRNFRQIGKITQELEYN